MRRNRPRRVRPLGRGCRISGPRHSQKTNLIKREHMLCAISNQVPTSLILEFIIQYRRLFYVSRTVSTSCSFLEIYRSGSINPVSTPVYIECLSRPLLTDKYRRQMFKSVTPPPRSINMLIIVFYDFPNAFYSGGITTISLKN